MADFLENKLGEKFFVGDVVTFDGGWEHHHHQPIVIAEMWDETFRDTTQDVGEGCHWIPANLVLIRRPVVNTEGWEMP